MPQRKKPRVTSSATRSKRSTKKPITNSARRSNRQKVSKAKVTTGGQGTPGSAKVTTGRGRSGPKLPKLPAKSAKVTRGGGTGRTAMPKESAARKAARLANRAAKGYRGSGGSTLSKVGGTLGKMAGKALVPLAMASEVRTMVQRQKRYNAQKAAMKRRKKK